MEIKLTKVLFYFRTKLLINIMRAFIFLFCAVAFSFTSNKVFPQNTKIVIDADTTVTVEDVFKIIKEQTDYRFIFQSQMFEGYPKVNLKKGKIKAHDLLLKSLSYGNLSYELTSKRNIRLKQNPININREQQKVISGKVTDANGTPLLGATVLVKNTTIGSNTDFDGKFTVTMPSGANTIVISFVGFKTQEIEVGDQDDINVVLIEDASTLDEVVITGYQTISRERATGAFSKISKEDIETRISTNLVDRLEGLTPGLSLDKDNNIQIRGVSTLYGNSEPLIVVDGFPIDGDLNTVNPEDIESITVLKDAAAASVWGTRAANGVVVITTTKQLNNGLNVNASYYRTIDLKQSVSDLQLMNTSDRIDMELDFWDNYYAWGDFYLTIENNRFNALNELYRRRYSTVVPDNLRINDTEFQSEIARLRQINGYQQFEDHLLQNAIKDQVNVSISSKTDTNAFVGSFGYNGDNSTSVGDESSRVVINLNNTLKLNDILDFNVGANIVYSKEKNNGLGTNFFNQYIGLAPYEPLVNENGERNQIYSMNFLFREGHEAMGLDYSYNPLDEVDANDNTTDGLSTRLQFGLNAKLNDDLSFSTKFQTERNFLNTENHKSVNNPTWKNILNDYYIDGEYILPYGGRLDLSERETKSWTLRNQINFDKDLLNGDLKITAIFGNEVRSSSFTSNTSQILGYDPQVASGIPYDVLAYQNSEIRNRYGYATFFEAAFPDVDIIENREVSYYFNQSYKLFNKYNISGSFRVDQANIFGFDKSAKNNVLWSTGLSWNIMEEAFMKADWIDRLNLRATYGVNGNRPNPGITAYLTGYVRAGNAFGSFGPFDQRYIELANPENPGLKSEKVYTTNIGLDYSLFNGKVSGVIEYYNKVSEDLIGPKTLNPTNGWDASIINYAEMRNRGVEFSINTSPVKTADFEWNTRLNFSYNKNEITDVNVKPTLNIHAEKPVGSAFDSRAGLPIKGHPIGRIFAYRWGGLDAEGLPQIINGAGETISYRDAVWADDLMEYQGTSVAPYYGSLFNTFAYKNITLGINFTYKLGHKMRAPVTTGLYDATISYVPVHESYANYWKQPGDENTTNVPAMRDFGLFEMFYYQTYYANADINIFDASQIRLRDVNIDYNIPQSLLGKTGIKSATLRFQAKNLWFWSANKWGLDSEAYEVTDGYFGSFNATRFPLPKTFILGLKVNF